MRRPRVTLSAYNTAFQTEPEFQVWVRYVRDHIEEEVGCAVDVDAAAFSGRNATFADEIDANEGQHEAIEEALRHLWDRGCAASFDLTREQQDALSEQVRS